MEYLAPHISMVVFFTFLAACVIISAWKRKKIETIRHETARLLIEKSPAIDSALLAEVFKPLSPSPKNKATRDGMKILGTIVVALGLGLWLMGLCFTFLVGDGQALGLGGPGTLLMVLGAGIIFAARFAPRPDDKTEVSKLPENGSEL